jgi:hypothetical protein
MPSASDCRKIDPIVSLSPFRLFRQTISSISNTQQGKNVEINYKRKCLCRQICLWYLKQRYCCWLLTTAEQKWFNLMPNPISEEGSSKDWRSHDSLLYIHVTVNWNVIKFLPVNTYKRFGRTRFHEIQGSWEYSCSEHCGGYLPNYKSIYFKRTVTLCFNVSKTERYFQYTCIIPFAKLHHMKLLDV